MPRGPRLDFPGAVHHVIVRGIERRKIFFSDLDRQDFLDRLGKAAPVCAATVYAWSLMPNHAHLLVRTRSASLSSMMRRLLTGYAGTFNRRHRRCGHLFQNRFKSILVEEEPYLLELVRYVHLNPVRAAIVADVRALDRYRWTGHAAVLGDDRHDWQDIDFVLDQFASHPDAARRAYRRFVLDGLENGFPGDLDGGRPSGDKPPRPA